MQRFSGLLATLFVAAALAACGRPVSDSGAGAQGSPSATAARPAATAAQPAATAAQPTEAPPTAAPAQPTAGVTAAAGAQATVDGVPYGRTPEGYHVLGDPGAPVTLTMYSDFL